MLKQSGICIPSLFVVLVSIFFMGLASAWYWPAPEAAFLSDASPVSWLSSALLWSIGFVALARWESGELPRGVLLWIACAMFSLAMDEQFMLHETWKYSCQAWFGICQNSWGRELPMLLVGGLGLITASVLQRQLTHQQAKWYLWMAISVGMFALAVDLFPSFAVVSGVAEYEEGFEVLAESLFAAMLLSSAPTYVKSGKNGI